ncbi:MAG: pentapeptide repeat-containing protein [Caulobacterales bacterium]|nr:pentapeptide repeat-containing protein [Caulobacterales bacterium]
MADGVEMPQVNEIKPLRRLTPQEGQIDFKGEFPGLANHPTPPTKQKETAAPGSSRDGGQSFQEGANPHIPEYHRGGDEVKSELARALVEYESEVARIAFWEIQCPFAYVDFRHLSYMGLDLSHRSMILRGFTHGNFNYGNFNHTCFENALLNQGRFEYSLFIMADLKRANLSESNFNYSNFSCSHLFGARARGANFANCHFDAAALEFADMRRVNFHGACLDHARFGHFHKPFVPWADLMGAARGNAGMVDMEGANFRGAVFGPLIFVGRAAAGTQIREMFLWSSVLGGAVVHMGSLGLTPAALREFTDSVIDDPAGVREVTACLEFLESLHPLARARKAAELGVQL